MRLDVGPVWKDEASRVVYGVASPDGLSAAEIQQAAHDYLARYEPPPGVRLVESYIAPADMTIAGGSVKKGSWVLGTEVTDPRVWARVQKGESVVYPTTSSIEKEQPMSTTDLTTSTMPTAVSAAVTDAIAGLQPFASDDPRIAALVSQLTDLTPSATGSDASSGASQPVAKAERLQEAMRSVDEIRKQEDLPWEVRKQADDASKRLQMEYLHEASPRAAELYEERLRFEGRPGPGVAA
jgi:hypothetical protein